MSWGIDFKADIYLSRQEYNTKNDVEERIKEIDKTINECETLIKMYASSTPKDIVPSEESEDPINWINNQINVEFEMYRDYLIDRYNLELYMDYLNDGGEIVKGG